MLSASSRVSELMQKDVVTVGPRDSLREAMALMAENHVSGLPVIDDRDRCVGVLSMSDVVALEVDQSATESPYEEVGSYYDPDAQQWETFRFAGSIDELPDLLVEEVMSRDLVSVTPTATVREAARLMLEHRVHRVLILDKKQYLHGIITALDLVRIVAES